MRNFSYTYPLRSAFLVDFLQPEGELALLREQLIRDLMDLFETRSEEWLSPSEKDVLDEFKRWFDHFREAGWKVSGITTPSRPFFESDLPANIAFTYVNFNTGKGLVLMGYFDDGHGDCKYAAQTL